MEHQEVQEHQEVVEVLDLQGLTGANGTSGSSGLWNIRKCRTGWKCRDLVEEWNIRIKWKCWVKWKVRVVLIRIRSGTSGSSGKAGISLDQVEAQDLWTGREAGTSGSAGSSGINGTSGSSGSAGSSGYGTSDHQEVLDWSGAKWIIRVKWVHQGQVVLVVEVEPQDHQVVPEHQDWRKCRK
jgi:hypothetical protein